MRCKDPADCGRYKRSQGRESLAPLSHLVGREGDSRVVRWPTLGTHGSIEGLDLSMWNVSTRECLTPLCILDMGAMVVTWCI